MARISDISPVLRNVGLWPFAKRVWDEVLDDSLLVYAGSLAYAWLFAIFPFFIFLLKLLPFLPVRDERVTIREIEIFLKALLPDLAAETLLSSMGPAIARAIERTDSVSAGRGILALLGIVASIVVALWAASGGIAVTMAALDKCYEIDRPRAYYKRRPMAFALTAGTAGLAALVILLLPVGSAFKAWALQYRSWEVSYWFIWAFDVGRGAMAITAVFAFLSLLYHFGPSVKHRYRYVTPGAAFTLVCWVIVGLAFREYVERFGGKYHETYGPVGGVAVLLVLFYLDALVLLIGAEINSEIDFEILRCERGSRSFLSEEDRLAGWLRRNRKRMPVDPVGNDPAASAPFSPDEAE